MRPGRKSLANTKAFSGIGLEGVRQFALMGDVPGGAYGIVHCLDGLLSKYKDFDGVKAPQILHGWVRQLQAIDVQAISNPKLKRALKEWLRQRPGTDFYIFNELFRILTLIVVPLAEARRQRDGKLVKAVARLIEVSTPESPTNYDATSWQEPLHPGLYAAVLAVQKAQAEGRLPRLSDIKQALTDAGDGDAVQS